MKNKIRVLLVCLMLAVSMSGCGFSDELSNQIDSLISEYFQDNIDNSSDVVSGSAVKDDSSDTSEVTDSSVVPDGGSEEEAIPKASIEKYAYSKLTDDEKTVYDEVLYGIENFVEEQEVSTLDEEVLSKIYTYILIDYPGIFWVDGYSYIQYTMAENPVSMSIKPEYTMTKAEKDGTQTSIDEKATLFLSGLPADADEYTKVKYVYEYLASNVEYNLNSTNNQNIISVFLNQSTVCQGYAKATQYLLEKLGVFAITVSGNANNEPHAWNLVMIDGEYYYVDTTWGNTFYSSQSSGETYNWINYNYLCITTEELNRTHTLSNEIELPECTAILNNYYVREGYYFSEFNVEQIDSLLENATSANLNYLSVKAENQEIYNQIYDYYINQKNALYSSNNISSLSYVEDSDQYVISFYFNY